MFKSPEGHHYSVVHVGDNETPEPTHPGAGAVLHITGDDGITRHISAAELADAQKAELAQRLRQGAKLPPVTIVNSERTVTQFGGNVDSYTSGDIALQSKKAELEARQEALYDDKGQLLEGSGVQEAARKLSLEIDSLNRAITVHHQLRQHKAQQGLTIPQRQRQAENQKALEDTARDFDIVQTIDPVTGNVSTVVYPKVKR